MTQERRQYDSDFKEKAVARVSAGESFAKVGESLGVHKNLIRRWYDLEHPKVPGAPTWDSPQVPQKPTVQRRKVSSGTHTPGGNELAVLRLRNEYLEKVLSLHGIKH